MPIPALDLGAPPPAVAAQFRTTLIERDAETEIEWRLWRSANEVVVENLTERTAEHWQRDGDALFRRALFHDERKGIEFQPADLAVTDAPTSLEERAAVFPPHLLTELEEVRSGWRDGTPYRQYEGEVDGASWRLVLAVDAMLPLELHRCTRDRCERTALTASVRLEAAPWGPVPAEGYELIDFADLGDRESDPFVTRAQSQLGPGHALGRN